MANKLSRDLRMLDEHRRMHGGRNGLSSKTPEFREWVIRMHKLGKTQVEIISLCQGRVSQAEVSRVISTWADKHKKQGV